MSRPQGGNAAEALFWLLFAGGTFALTYTFDQPLSTYAFGPAGWPRILIGGIALAALALLLSSLASRRSQGPLGVTPSSLSAVYDDPDGAPAGESLPAASLRTAMKRLAIFVLPLAYVLAMGKIGFLPVTPFFLIAYMYVLGVRGWFALSWVTLVIYGLVVVIFVKLLYTPLPQGAGFFHSVNGKLISLIQ